MRKLQGLATGVVVELADGKVLKINGPAQKVGHLINVMQRLVNMSQAKKLLVVFGPATKNYIAIIVGGPQVVNHLAALQQTVGANGRVAMEEKLHFSVCHTEGEWSAVQVAHLAKDVESIVAQAPQTIHDTFTCDDVAFFNPTGHRAQGIHYAHVRLFVSLQLSKCWFSTWCVSSGPNQPRKRDCCKMHCSKKVALRWRQQRTPPSSAERRRLPPLPTSSHLSSQAAMIGRDPSQFKKSLSVGMLPHSTHRRGNTSTSGRSMYDLRGGSSRDILSSHIIRPDTALNVLA
ncbi:predicted protein [Lichtheimia corymbifera JMRC:FSU:9682]|uniref:Uncharacterized protein n=1 Tax=Lichtheimia corymbifera JMRC:FSU:9682 TaxID=1263082 RepID=A0A068RV43_9FUNG|nr:predicted protein [Lichtheimia corymbifera JMRC:FSU:9682]